MSPELQCRHAVEVRSSDLWLDCSLPEGHDGAHGMSTDAEAFEESEWGATYDVHITWIKRDKERA